MSLPQEHPLTINYPSNHAWIIYGNDYRDIYAQPISIQYPLFIKVNTWGVGLGSNRTPNQILKLLTIWSESIPNFQEFYSGLPFLSSRIYIDDRHLLYTNNHHFRGKGSVKVIPSWWFEHRILTLAALKNIWCINPNSSKDFPGSFKNTKLAVPPTVSVTSLVLKAWLHNTVNLVTIRDASGTENSALYAFKTNGRTYQLYQEIYSLLNLPSHENIIQISFLVTKNTLYSLHNPLDPASPYLSKPTEPIIGFLTPYHPGGRLRDNVKSMDNAGMLTEKHKAKWARQLTSALLHVYQYENGGDKSRCGVYTNLKMDNVILTSPENGSNLLLIDFEKGHNWEAYDAPELDYPTTQVDPNIYASTTDILTRRNSIHEYAGPMKMNYENKYWAASNRSNRDREASMVWSLGSCLWCILQGHGCLKNVLVTESPRTIHSYPSNFLSEIWQKPGIPERVQAVVTKCFMSSPSQRPRLKELLCVIEEWENGLNLEKGVGDAGPVITMNNSKGIAEDYIGEAL